MFSRELMCECVQEAMPLLVKHHKEVIGDTYVLDPRWEEYALLERLGRYLVFTARDDGLLVGYAAFFVDRSMHSKHFTCARNDAFYVAESKRGTAMSLGFLRYCHRYLKGEGAQHVDFECVDKNLLWPILDAIGYKPIGRRLGMTL